jgi:hypothetical protein
LSRRRQACGSAIKVEPVTRRLGSGRVKLERALSRSIRRGQTSPGPLELGAARIDFETLRPSLIDAEPSLDL